MNIMKNYILLASAAMMVATVSCTVDMTPKGEAPASNEITFDAADLKDIRPGEVITATMVIPTGGKNILREERGWKNTHNKHEQLWIRESTMFLTIDASELVQQETP